MTWVDAVVLLVMILAFAYALDDLRHP